VEVDAESVGVAVEMAGSNATLAVVISPATMVTDTVEFEYPGRLRTSVWDPSGIPVSSMGVVP